MVIMCDVGTHTNRPFEPVSDPDGRAPKAARLTGTHRDKPGGVLATVGRQRAGRRGTHRVDLFFTCLNTNVARFSSEHYIPGSEAVDALAQS